MAHKPVTWLISLRLIANLVPWLIVFQSAWDIGEHAWTTGSVEETLVGKLLFFALVGALVAWGLPPHDRTAGVAANVTWVLRIAVTVGLWIVVFDRLWIIISAIWTGGERIGAAFVACTVGLVVAAYIVNRVWMPQDVAEMLKR